jgi:hypothetical protein
VRLGDCQIVNLQMNTMVAGRNWAGAGVHIVGGTTLSEYKEPIQEATTPRWCCGLNVANGDDAQSFLAAGSRGASRSTGQSRTKRRWSCCPVHAPSAVAGQSHRLDTAAGSAEIVRRREAIDASVSEVRASGTTRAQSAFT